MDPIETLAALAGSWRGTSSLQDPQAGMSDQSPSVLTVTLVLGGRFVRLDYAWSYHGQPQEGSLLIGFDKQDGMASAHWIDSWHMGSKVMTCSGKGARPAGHGLSLRGSYAAPPGPDWGWRIDLTSESAKLRLVMFNIWPAEQGGKEELAVEAVYERV